jgi:excisionase family DNA binding protein
MARNGTPNSSVVELTALGEWMTVEEVCELLGVARSTLDEWRKKETHPFPAPRKLPNRCIRYRRCEVAAWLEYLPRAA